MNKKEINKLINKWLEEGKVSQDQANYMISDLDISVSENSGNKFISAVMYIGAIALALGFFLLIASNWSGLGKGVKLILTLLLPIVPIVFAYWKIIVKNHENVLARAANLLGMALVGGSMTLIGQIYNLDPNISGFLWTWVLLTAPFIFIFKKAENVFFSAVLVGGTLIYSLVRFIFESGMEEGTALLVSTIVLLVYAYVLYFVGVTLRNAENWLSSGRLLRLGSAGLATTVLFITTFNFYARTVVGYSYYNNQGANWHVFALFFNLLFIGFLVFALIRAVKHEEYAFSFTIVRVFGLYLLVKYITLFSSMLDTGLFFVLGGALFIAGGWVLEKNKNKLVSYMKSGKTE